jgi:hypothetical protein
MKALDIHLHSRWDETSYSCYLVLCYPHLPTMRQDRSGLVEGGSDVSETSCLCVLDSDMLVRQ